MNSVLICPNCRTPTEYQGSGQPACSACGTRLSARADAAGNQAAERQRPLLLLMLMVFLASLATIGLIITFMAVTVPGNEDYIVDNRLATQSDFLIKMLPFILLYLAAAPIAYGLWKNGPGPGRSSSRSSRFPSSANISHRDGVRRRLTPSFHGSSSPRSSSAC